MQMHSSCLNNNYEFSTKSRTLSMFFQPALIFYFLFPTFFKPSLSDTEFYLILKSEWKAMNNHERRLWRRRVKVKKPKQSKILKFNSLLKLENTKFSIQPIFLVDQQKTSIVPSKPSSSLKPRVWFSRFKGF